MGRNTLNQYVRDVRNSFLMAAVYEIKKLVAQDYFTKIKA